MSRFTQPPIAQPAGGGNFSGAALAAHINELVAAIASGHFDLDAPTGAGKGLFRSRPNGDNIELVLNDGDEEVVLLEYDPVAGTLSSPQGGNPFSVTAEQVGAYTKAVVDQMFGEKPNRNLIINGGMTVWQRAAVATNMVNGYSSVDRWRGFMNTSGAFTAEHKTLTVAEKALTGQGQALQLKVTTADTSIAATHYASISQRIEARDLQHLRYGHADAKTLTLSFWVKSNKPGTYCVTLNKEDNTEYNFVGEYTINAANVYEYKTITITPDAGGTSFITSSEGRIDNNSGKGLDLVFGLAWGASYHAAADSWHSSGNWATSNQVNWMDNTSNNFEITGVQLEVGARASVFEHQTYGEVLKQCRRYYQVYKGMQGVPCWAYNSNVGGFTLWYDSPMRSGISGTVLGTPTNDTSVQGSSEYTTYHGTAYLQTTALSLSTITINSIRLIFNVTSGLGIDDAFGAYFGPDAGIALESEL